MSGNPKTSLTIDTHHHILPDFFWQETENANAPVGGLAPLRWSREASVSFMDEAGIDVAVVSLSTPGVHTGDSAKARALARRCNEFSAELVHARPDRFGGFACLPLPDVDASLEEMSYALDVLKLDGIVVFTNSNGVYLGDPVLEPVFAELERRNAVVYVHPNPSPDAVAHTLGLPDNLLDFPTDTNRAVAQMHYTNRFARTPNVKYIFSHAGGSIPYLAARFAIIDEMGFIPGGEKRGPAADMFRRIYWDTALAASDPVFHMLREVAGINQVLYGTDFPYLRRDLAVRCKRLILESSELKDSEKSAVLGGNAAQVFPRLKQVEASRFGGLQETLMSQHMTISPDEAANRLAIRELIEAYARCADRRDAQGQMSLFTPDTHFVVYMNAKDSKPAQELHSREALAPVFADLNQYAATMHFLGQSTILSLTDDRGTGEAYCLAHHLTVDGDKRQLMIAALRYYDTFVKQDGSWLFAERLLYVDWLEERALS